MAIAARYSLLYCLIQLAIDCFSVPSEPSIDFAQDGVCGRFSFLLSPFDMLFAND